MEHQRNGVVEGACEPGRVRCIYSIFSATPSVTQGTLSNSRRRNQIIACHGMPEWRMADGHNGGVDARSREVYCVLCCSPLPVSRRIDGRRRRRRRRSGPELSGVGSGRCDAVHIGFLRLPTTAARLIAWSLCACGWRCELY